MEVLGVLCRHTSVVELWLWAAVGLCADTLLLLYCVQLCSWSPPAVSPVCSHVVLFWPVPLSPSSAPGAALVCPPPGVLQQSRAVQFVAHCGGWSGLADDEDCW